MGEWKYKTNLAISINQRTVNFGSETLRSPSNTVLKISLWLMLGRIIWGSFWNCWLRVNSRNLNRNMTLFCILVELGSAPQPRSGPCNGARYKGDDKGLSKYRQHRYCRQCLPEHGDYGVGALRRRIRLCIVWHMDLIRSVTPTTFEARNRVLETFQK